MNADDVIERINFLDAERQQIEKDRRNAPQGEKQRHSERKWRNVKTVYALYEILEAKQYEKTKSL